MLAKTIAAASIAAAALAATAPSSATAAPICNTTSAGDPPSVTICVEANTTNNIVEGYFEWCLRWSFDCQTTPIVVAKGSGS